MENYPTPDFIRDVAIGDSTLEEIAYRHDVSPEDVESFRNAPEFERRVAKEQYALKQSGELLKRRAAHGELLAIERMVNALYSTDTSVTQVIEIKKSLRDSSGVDKQAGLGPAGQGFSITINIPQIGAKPAQTLELHSEAIDVTPVPLNTALALPEGWSDE